MDWPQVVVEFGALVEIRLMRGDVDVEHGARRVGELVDHGLDLVAQPVLAQLALRMPRRLVRPAGRQYLQPIELDDLAFQELDRAAALDHVVDEKPVVVAGRREALDALLRKSRARPLEPLLEALLNQLVKERLLPFVAPRDLAELVLVHDLRVEAHVRSALDERGHVVAGQPDLLSGERSQITPVWLARDRHDHLPTHVAAEYQDARAIELGGVHELLEADVRAVNVGGEEDLEFAAWIALPLEHGSLEKREITIDLPGGDLVVVVPPLRRFELDVGALQLRPERRLHGGIRVKGLDGFEERARKRVYPQLPELLVVLEVHVEANRIARIDLVLDAVEAGMEVCGRRQVGVARRVDGAAFHARARQRNSKHVGPVVPAVRPEDRRPRKAGHRPGLYKALVRVHSRAGDGRDRRRVREEPADEVVGELRDAVPAW